MDFRSFKTWRNLVSIIVMGTLISCGSSTEDETDSTESTDWVVKTDTKSSTETYVIYTDYDKRFSTVYNLNRDGSATIEKQCDGETTITNNGYWDEYNNYIKVTVGSQSNYIDLEGKKIYPGYNSYRSRTGGYEFVKRTN